MQSVKMMYRRVNSAIPLVICVLVLVTATCAVLPALTADSHSLPGNTYTFALKWPNQQWLFKEPCGVAVDGSGDVYVTDMGNDRIQKFTSNGVFLTQWGSRGTGDGQFSAPTGVAVDNNGDIYVADTGNNRIQKFVVS